MATTTTRKAQQRRQATPKSTAQLLDQMDDEDENVPAHVLERLAQLDPDAPTYTLEQVCRSLGVDYVAIQREARERIHARRHRMDRISPTRDQA